MAIGTGLALAGGALLSAGVSAYGASQAAGAAKSAAGTQAQAQMAQLEYLKEREAIPQAYREQAISQLGALYGLPGAPAPAPEATPGAPAGQWVGGGRGGRRWVPGQAPVPEAAAPAFAPLGRGEFVAGLQQDPFYEQLRATGEEAVLRGASATGGLRSGGASEALAAQNQAVLRGLYQERVAGLGGLAGLPSGAQQIGQVMGQIGQTQAAGITAAGQAQQQGLQNIGNIGLGALGMGLQYGVI